MNHTFTEVYDKVKSWRDGFDERAKIDPDPQLKRYYTGMVSGLDIALQEIDLERYEREKK